MIVPTHFVIVSSDNALTLIVCIATAVWFNIIFKLQNLITRKMVMAVNMYLKGLAAENFPSFQFSYCFCPVLR